MAFGQSYLIGKAYGWAIKQGAIAFGMDEDDAHVIGKASQVSMAAVVSVLTIDPIGAGKTVAAECVECAVDT